MILWCKRGATVLSGILLMGLLFSSGNRWAGVAGGMLNLAFAMAEKFPASVGRFLPSLFLVFNTLLSAYGVLAGGAAILAVPAAGASLFAWNGGMFVLRWPQAPVRIQYLYLRRMGRTLILGLGAGLSALALQGHFALSFPLAFSLALIGSLLFLRIISGALQKPR